MGLFISFLMGVALVVGIVAVPEIMAARRNRQALRELTSGNDALLADLDSTKPAIIYFTADWCGPCQLMQRPEMEKFEAVMGDSVQVKWIDVDAESEAASRWQVQSVPRTYIIGRDQQIHTANMKPTAAHILQEQVEAAWA